MKILATKDTFEASGADRDPGRWAGCSSNHDDRAAIQKALETWCAALKPETIPELTTDEPTRA